MRYLVKSAVENFLLCVPSQFKHTVQTRMITYDRTVCNLLFSDSSTHHFPERYSVVVDPESTIGTERDLNICETSGGRKTETRLYALSWSALVLYFLLRSSLVDALVVVVSLNLTHTSEYVHLI